ncbi:MAG: right-handed parallel beta-helix repeat-containing protein, partial [Candidatus Pacebacteria bacterium]|nr:right-handed parallel beta-helix repeat-containing protein [Candidatus Paceibacterota bacterium]
YIRARVSAYTSITTQPLGTQAYGTGSITIDKSYVTLEGVGDSSKLYLTDGANVTVITVGDGTNSFSNITISDLYINRNAQNYNSGILLSSNATKSTIEKVYVYSIGTNASGISISSGSTHNLITNNTIDTASSSSSGLRINGTYNRIIGNTVKNITSGGGIYLVNGGSQNTISNNILDGNNRGISLQVATNNTISGNMIKNSLQAGIELGGPSGGQLASYNSIVSNIILDSSQTTNDTYSAIYIQRSSTYNIIQGNEIRDTAANKSKYGIYELSSSDDYNTITNNIIQGPVTADIYAQGPHTTVAGNKTSDATEGLFDISSNTGATQSALTVTQSGTGNIINLTGDSITIGTGMALSVDGLTTGTGFDIASTSIALTTGKLLSLNWSPGSATTATGDLLSINIGADGTIGNLLNITDDGTTLFSVSQSAITMNRPLQVNVAGNTGMSYDLNFMNTGLSQITSEGPLMISAGDSNHYENLTLTTGGTGDIVMDIADSLLGLKVLGSADGGYAMKLSPTGNMDLSQDLALTGGILTVAELSASDLGTPATSTATSGGSCADSTIYYYKITALNGNGETTGTTEFNETTGASGSNINTITVSWIPVHGATGYKVYRSTETGDWDADGNDVLVDDTTISAGTTTLTDDCSGDAASNAPPSTNSTGGRIGINIADATPDARIEVLDADSGNPQMRLAQSDNTDYADFEVDATGDLTITMSGDDLIIDDNLKVCSGACPTTGYSITGAGNLVVENKVVADSFERICADGYIWVPGSAKFGTMPGFCVMKYEAKGTSGVVVSTSTGLPYVSISQKNARSECIGIGTGYHLISGPEWMTIAENIANLAINDLDSDAGLQLATGHSDNADAGAASNAVASIDSADPVVSGCVLTSDMENASNAYVASSCEIRGDGSHGTDPGDANDKGFYDTGQDWADGTYVSGAANKAQLRTHVLSNGEVIWDIAGNVWEWADALSIAQEHPVDATPASEWFEYTAIVKYNNFNYIRPPDDGWSSTNGIGRIYSDYDDGTATRGFTRSGGWPNTTGAGVFTLTLDSLPTDTDASLGFRCAK